MKTISVIMLAFVVGLSACGKKKKKTAARTTGNEAGKATTKVNANFGIELDTKTMKLTIKTPAKIDTAKKDDCSIVELVEKMNKEQAALDMALDKSNGKFALKSSAGALLEGTKSDKKNDSVLGKYNGSVEGLTFAISDTSLALEKACAAKAQAKADKKKKKK